MRIGGSYSRRKSCSGSSAPWTDTPRISVSFLDRAVATS
jgi:hypothetical protein